MSKRMYIGWTIILLALLLGSLLAACGAGAGQDQADLAGGEQAAPAALDGQALVQERCTACHDLGRVESAGKTAEGWQANVERMVSHGAKLDEAEQQAVIAYLSEAHPE